MFEEYSGCFLDGQHVPRGLAALAFHFTLIASSMNRSVSVFRRSLQSLTRHKLINLHPLHALNKRPPNLFLDCVEDSSLGLSGSFEVFQAEDLRPPCLG